MSSHFENNFRTSFKHFKSKLYKPDYSEIMDPATSKQAELISSPDNLDKNLEEKADHLGVVNPKLWKLYSITTNPGLYIIKNPFSKCGQLLWAQELLCSVPRHTNYSNLKAHNVDLQDTSWWTLLHSKYGKEQEDLKRYLRWVTLGYHHNWDTKVYSNDHHDEVPQQFQELCEIFSQYLGFYKFKAEAIIVNYYHKDSTLSPHQDTSEPYIEAPLFSFSFGESAIFLIGGDSKTIIPTPILLNSGDVMIMTGESRKAYHAVPKIISGTKIYDEIDYKNYDLCSKDLFNYKQRLKEFCQMNETLDANAFWKSVIEYCSNNRLNINVRQVHPPAR